MYRLENIQIHLSEQSCVVSHLVWCELYRIEEKTKFVTDKSFRVYKNYTRAPNLIISNQIFIVIIKNFAPCDDGFCSSISLPPIIKSSDSDNLKWLNCRTIIMFAAFERWHGGWWRGDRPLWKKCARWVIGIFSYFFIPFIEN